MRLFFVGDVVGKQGVNIVCQAVPGFRRRENIDLVVVNAENADGGSGITPAIYRKKDSFKILNKESDIIKPANFPPESPGKGWTTVTTSFGRKVAVVSLMGRVFMRPVDCPFHAAEKVLKEIPDEINIRFVDFHAEATSDKQLMGRFLDGKVSAVLGTHTHVTTADERILPKGTAFQCDVGMTGPHESILGRDIDSVMETTVTFFPKSFHVAHGDVRISGSIVEIDRGTGKATSITRVSIDEEEARKLESYID